MHRSDRSVNGVCCVNNSFILLSLRPHYHSLIFIQNTKKGNTSGSVLSLLFLPDITTFYPIHYLINGADLGGSAGSDPAGNLSQKVVY